LVYWNLAAPNVKVGLTQPAAAHSTLGQKLARLRDEGILVMGSGNVVHNLATMRVEENVPPFDWAARFNFNARVRESIERADHPSLVNYLQWGNDAEQAVPTPEHFLPLLYIIGQKSDDEGRRLPSMALSSDR
jgi:4,5-DOPA dioxygenase extradiol